MDVRTRPITTELRFTATSEYAAVHSAEGLCTPKMPGEPPRVQPSKKVAANWDEDGNRQTRQD